MADLKTNYVDDVLETTKNQLRKYQQIQNDDGTVSFVDVTEYAQVGTSFGAKDINDTNAAINDVNRKLGDLLTATITSGDTSATITDSKIKSTSIIDIYFENKVLAPENVTVSDGSIIVEISAQDTDTVVGVRVI